MICSERKSPSQPLDYERESGEFMLTCDIISRSDQKKKSVYRTGDPYEHLSVILSREQEQPRAYKAATDRGIISMSEASC